MMSSIYDTYDRYDVEFFDDTILTLVTDIPYLVEEWISEIEYIHRNDLRHLIVGLDVEWRPSFSKHVHNPVATLQLCVGRRCLIFQIIHAPYIPQSLVNFFGNMDHTFTGVGIHEDILKLYNDYNLCVWKVADLRELAADKYDAVELYKAGLKDLARRVLEKEMFKPKCITMSRWDEEWLSLAQVRYACLDAFLSFEIGRILINGDVNRD